MCHNVMDGRFHTLCGHFFAMATQKQDCLETNCVFSTRHPPDCKKTTCTYLMAPPARNPIRVSPTDCSDCTRRLREGVLGLGVSAVVDSGIRSHLQAPQLVTADKLE